MIFVGLSAYALTTKKDFSFMGGFLMVGILLAFLAGLAAIFFEIPRAVADRLGRIRPADVRPDPL
jgi:FtsH-binding integral membrane protein